MSIKIFSFPPDCNFENEWLEGLAMIQKLETEKRFDDIENISSYLDSYEQQLIDSETDYQEESERINELASLALRVTRSYE